MPAATVESSARGRANGVMWFAAFAASAFVLAVRAPDSLVQPQFWAEDGFVFFATQLHRALPQLFLPHAGYLHLIPRLVAWIASAFPALHAPAIYNGAALLIGAMSIASLRELRLGVGGFAFLLAPFALTPTNGEVFGTVTNAQWLTQFYLLVVVHRFLAGQAPANAWRAALATVFVGLSGPFCIFACLAAGVGWLWAWRVEGRNDLSPRAAPRSPGAVGIGILLLCAIVQLTVVKLRSPVPAATLSQWSDGMAMMFKSLQGHFFGHKLIPDGIFLAAAAGIVAASLVWIPGPGTARSTILFVTTFVLAGFVAASVKSLSPALVSEEIPYGDRYFLAAKIFLWWCIALLLARVWPGSTTMRLASLLILLGAGAAYASVLLQRQPLPNLNWPEYAAKIDRGDAVTVPLNPGRRMVLPAREPPSPAP